MTYDNAKWQELTNKGVFSGGYVDNNPDFFLGGEYATYLRNARLDGQTITKRPGHGVLTTLTGGTYPKGLKYYNNGVVVLHNSKLYYIDSAGDETEIITKYILGTNDYTTTLATWTAISDGEFRYGTTDITGLDFTTATSIEECFEIIQDAIDTATSKTNTIVRPEGTKLVINGSEIIIVVVPGGTGTDIRTIMGVNSYNAQDLSLLLHNNYRIYMFLIGGDLYIFLGNLIGNSNRSVLKLTGLSLLAITYLGTTPAGFQPAFGVVFDGKLFVAGWDDHPNSVYYSSGLNFSNFTTDGASSMFLQESITGLSANNEGIFYFTQNSIFSTGLSDIVDDGDSFSYKTRVLTAKEGAVNQGSIVAVGNNIFYLTPSKKINRVTKGGNTYGFEVIEISDRPYNGIGNIMQSLDDNQADSIGYYLENKGLIKWFVKTSGATQNDLCIVYDTEKDKFLIDDNKPFFLGDSNGTGNYTSGYTADIFEDETGVLDQNSLINFEYRTKEFYVGGDTNKKIFRETRTLLDLNQVAILKQKLLLDGYEVDETTLDITGIDGGSTTAIFDGVINGGDTTTLFTGVEGGLTASSTDDLIEQYIMITKGKLNRRARKIQFIFTEGTAGAIRLKNLSVKAETLPELTNSLTI